jgi:peptidoglycan/LPS O-acetylase OafA/YrhL
VAVLHNSQRLEYLDALRGIAALMVAYFHYSRYFLQEGIVTSGFEYQLFFFFNNYVDLGKVGVIIFFAISGIVIPYSLVKGGEHPVKRFVVSRFARLYPIYWLSIPLGFFAYWFLDDKEITITTFLINFTMLQQFFLVENVMGLYWTLQIELIFYFLCVILYVFNWLDVSKKLFYTAATFVFLALVASWFRFQFQIKIPVALFLALAFMFFGSIWRDYLINRNENSKFYSFMLLVIIIAAMPFISFLAYNQDLGFGETWYRYLLSYYTAIILLVFFTLFVKIRGSFFVWLGRISYSVYLFHGVVFVVFMHFIGSELILNVTLSAHFYIGISMVVTLLFSNITYNYVEKPMINFGRKINSKLSPKQSCKVGAV